MPGLGSGRDKLLSPENWKAEIREITKTTWREKHPPQIRGDHG